MPVWCPMSYVSVREGCFFENSRFVEVDFIVEVRVSPEALDLAARRVGEV